MDNKKVNLIRSFNESSGKSVLESLMKEMKLNPKLKDELLYFADCGKSFPYVPRELIKPQKSQTPALVKALPKLPPKPLQRLKSTIIESGSYEVEKYRPNPSKSRPPKEKERLQNLMAFGEEFMEENAHSKGKGEELKHFDASDLFDEILMEIKERRIFIEEMTNLGMGKKYLPEIQCQISLRLKELEKLDKDRAERIYRDYGIR